MRFRNLVVTCALLGAMAPGLHAQSYPARPIRIIVPVPPGLRGLLALHPSRWNMH